MVHVNKGDGGYYMRSRSRPQVCRAWHTAALTDEKLWRQLFSRELKVQIMSAAACVRLLGQRQVAHEKQIALELFISLATARKSRDVLLRFRQGLWDILHTADIPYADIQAKVLHWLLDAHSFSSSFLLCCKLLFGKPCMSDTSYADPRTRARTRVSTTRFDDKVPHAHVCMHMPVCAGAQTPVRMWLRSH